MEVLIQFDQSGLYQDTTWGKPVPYHKGDNPLGESIVRHRAD
ncbi:hypothetical protein [Vibrio galatheae]